MVQGITDLSTVVPMLRRNVVAELVRQVVVQPDSPVIDLLREELERCIAATGLQR